MKDLIYLVKLKFRGYLLAVVMALPFGLLTYMLLEWCAR